jgi:hypothetical protein
MDCDADERAEEERDRSLDPTAGWMKLVPSVLSSLASTLSTNSALAADSEFVMRVKLTSVGTMGFSLTAYDAEPEDQTLNLRCGETETSPRALARPFTTPQENVCPSDGEQANCPC